MRDLTGKKFGRLIVVGRGPNNKQGHLQWHCRCRCGKDSLVRTHDLTSGRTQSCGCLSGDLAARRNKQRRGLVEVRIPFTVGLEPSLLARVRKFGMASRIIRQAIRMEIERLEKGSAVKSAHKSLVEGDKDTALKILEKLVPANNSTDNQS